MNKEKLKWCLDNDVVKAFAEGKQIQLKTEVGNQWIDVDELNLDNFCTYPHYYRIKPEPVKVPLEAKDWNGIWWIRTPMNPNIKFLVLSIYSEGITINGGSRTFSDLRKNDWERSRDMINWEPCEKEVV